MYIGISRPSWEAQDNQQIFSLAKEYKFDGIQVKPHQYDPIGIDPNRFKQTYGDLSYLARGGIIVYLGRDYTSWEEMMPNFLSFVKGIGGKQICICAGVKEEDLDSRGIKGVAEVLNELGKQANNAGAVVSLHNHAGSLFESIERIKQVFEYIDPQYCGMTFDTAHAAKGGINDLAGALEHFRAFVNNVHLKDLSSEGEFCALGEGTLDLNSVLKTLKTWDYQEWLIVDEETKGMNVQDAFHKSAAFLRANGVLMKGR